MCSRVLEYRVGRYIYSNISYYPYTSIVDIIATLVDVKDVN